ncbi:MAG: type II toxin-antitoxin system RelE/ParE family toxin [Paludibacteraceae bacterium]|nr:type II toxin-antitoxin system RelE/ParE family toxin [Paludibacteraceae bacterium]
MMQIIWSERAFIRRQAIEDYILISFGYIAYTKYVHAIDAWKELVLTHPQAGAIEPLLTGMRKEYRSFVIANQTKCIYYIEGNDIVFVDWWDTRRSIQTLTSGLH